MYTYYDVYIYEDESTNGTYVMTFRDCKKAVIWVQKTYPYRKYQIRIHG